jgi:type I restriction enzyme S subunit
MNPAQLLAQFDRISDAPDAIPRLRQLILTLAIRGKLVEQDPRDEPAECLLTFEQRVDAKRAVQARSNDLPKGWARVCLDQLVALKKGKKPAVLNEESRGLPYLDIAALERGELRHFTEDEKCPRASSSDLVVVCDGSRSGLLLDGREGILGSTLAVIQFSGFMREYLRVLLNALYEDLNAAKKGAAIPHLNIPRLLSLCVDLPPLGEQQRIAAKVDELMGLCDRLEAVQAKRESRRHRLVASSLNRLNNGVSPDAFRQHARFYFNHLPRLTTRLEHIQQLRQTIFNLAVRGQLVPQDPNDKPASELLKRIQAEKARLVKAGILTQQKPKSSEPRELAFACPMNWQAVNFSDLCNLVTSGSRGWAEFYSDTGPKFIRAQNIRFGRLRLDDLACVSLPKKAEGTRTQVSQGDLLIVITGAGVTNPALLDHELGEAYVSQHVALIKPTATSLSRWLLLCLMAPVGARAELVQRAYGAGKPGLNLDNIRSLRIPLPPLAEQNRIVSKVDELIALCDRLEAQLTTAQTESRRLLESVLHYALSA